MRFPSKHLYTAHLLWILVLATLLSCTRQKNASVTDIISEKEQLKSDIIDSILPPDTLMLSGKNAPIEIVAGEPEFQELKIPGGKPAFTNYGLEQGYDFSYLQSLYADDKGYLWFGVGNALIRYDGHTFINFNESNGLDLTYGVTHIMQDNEGNLWISAWSDGIFKFDGKSFENFFGPEHLADSIILCSVQDNDNNIWFSSLNLGLIKYDGNSFETVKITKESEGFWISDLLSESKGNLWVATNKGAYRYDGKSFTHISNDEGLGGDNVKFIYEDKSGNLWFCLGKDGVSKVDGETFINYSEEDGLASRDIKSIVHDNNNQYWIASDDGLYRFDGNSFTFYTEEHGLIGKNIHELVSDKSGKVWIGTEKGLNRYDGDIISQYTEEEGFPASMISCLDIDQENTIWIATDNGLLKYPSFSLSDSSMGFRRFTIEHGLRDNSINHVLVGSSGDIWLGTPTGLSKFNGKTFIHFPNAYEHEYHNVAYIFQDKKDRIWFTHNGYGVSCLDGDMIYDFNSKHGFHSILIRGITEDSKGNMWFGGAPGMLSKFDGSSIINYYMPEQLNIISSFYLDAVQNGDLWISYMGRVARFDGTSFETGSDIDGLTNAYYGNILEDTVNDVIWFGGINGITGLKSDYGAEPADEHFSYYNYKNGYPISIANNIGISDNGELWFSNRGELSRFNPHHINEKQPPPISITSFGINNDRICWDALFEINKGDVTNSQEGKVYAFCKKHKLKDIERLRNLYSNIQFDHVSGSPSVPVNPVLSYHQNSLNFEFSAISTSYSESIRYHYLLEGYDENWSPLGTKNQANYTKVSPGNYVFRVKALNPSGLWSETAFNFRILPPWWKTWWAYSVYLFITIAALYAIDRFQRRRIRERTLFNAREKELEQAREIEKAYHQLKTTQSQLVHAEKMASLGELTAGIAHEIQNPLNFIKNFSEVNIELTEELLEELDGGKPDDLRLLASDIIKNEKKIAHHGMRADGIVKSMLYHSHAGKAEKELTDINALADECLRLSYHGLKAKDNSFSASYSLDKQESLPQIVVNPQEIGRVFLNLINNAFHAVTEHRQKKDEKYEPVVIVRTKMLKDSIEIRITDNGGGIPENILDKIFQPFFTTKPSGEGTGLGLSISYDIINKGHGGDLKVESKENEGCEFIITLPVNPLT